MSEPLRTIDAQELLELYQSGIRDFNRIDLDDDDLSEVTLSGILLQYARVAWVDLSRSVFADADLTGTTLTGSMLWRTNFSRAQLTYTDLSRVNLIRGVLREASLRHAVLIKADLRLCDLREADLTGADLRRTDLRYADLRGACLEGAKLSGARLTGIQVDESSQGTLDAHRKFNYCSLINAPNPLRGVIISGSKVNRQQRLSVITKS